MISSWVPLFPTGRDFPIFFILENLIPDFFFQIPTSSRFFVIFGGLTEKNWMRDLSQPTEKADEGCRVTPSCEPIERRITTSTTPDDVKNGTLQFSFSLLLLFTFAKRSSLSAVSCCKISISSRIRLSIVSFHCSKILSFLYPSILYDALWMNVFHFTNFRCLDFFPS